MTRDISRTEHKTLTDPPLNVVLYQPEIPYNTGNIARLCGAAAIRLHLVHPLGFRVDDRHLKRAGLDYWREVDVLHHQSYEDFLEGLRTKTMGRLMSFSRHGGEVYTRARVHHGDYLLFGSETRGLPPHVRDAFPCYRVPIWGNVRSLNLSTTVGIVVYHYLHQMGRF